MRLDMRVGYIYKTLLELKDDQEIKRKYASIHAPNNEVMAMLTLLKNKIYQRWQYERNIWVTDQEQANMTLTRFEINLCIVICISLCCMQFFRLRYVHFFACVMCSCFYHVSYGFVQLVLCAFLCARSVQLSA